MSKKVQQYRGLEKDLPVLEEGRIAFTTDTKRLFIGSNNGNIEITEREEIENLANLVVNTNIIAREKSNDSIRKKQDTFSGDLFDWTHTANIGISDANVSGAKRITITAPTNLPNHLNVALYDVMPNVRAFEFKFDNSTSGSRVKIGFGNDKKNFIFINFTSGELYLVQNGVLRTSGLPTFTPITIADGDIFKFVCHGSNTIQVFKNNKLVDTYKNETAYILPRLNKNYPSIIFRSGAETDQYGVINVKTYQKTFNRLMHLSIDDFIYTLKSLNTQSSNSLFDHGMFAFLKRMHDKYGAVFTLNLLYADGTFNLSQMTNKFKTQFHENSHWLKFSFHGYDGVVDYSTLDATTAKTHYDTVISEIIRFASVENIDTIIRSSMFRGSLAVCQAWRDTNYGVTGFYTADDDRSNNMYLDTAQINSLKACDDLYDAINDLYFLKTDLRIDTMLNPEETLDMRKTSSTHRGHQDALIIFCHDTDSYQQIQLDAIEKCCKWACDNGYIFNYPMHLNPRI